MNERTKKLEAIFHAAAELNSPEERDRYLDDACSGDLDLRREIEELLNAAPIGDELFQPCEQRCRPAEPLSEIAGSVIGRYKLLEKIGEGGMGVVYMAEQEQPVRRKVALKIIKLGMDTRQVIARFEAERQALAMMDHPHIAQVLDGGATDTGRPYFVMELVEGVPITEFCEANQLSIKERLKLFIPVCHAIQSAHQKGIIHRDIKPSNVLVTMHNGSPHPMVIDFGVAKAIDQKLTEKTLFTNFATMIGTPAYMSPEQAEMSKLDVDTRSDIYSLGVLLYELLTGTTPFPEERLRSVAYGEMQRIIAEEEPERPSTRLRKRITPQSQTVSRKSQIDSDLDWMVMRCLEKDRSRRYETAKDLAADLDAYLTNTPIKARPPAATYRLRKFVRRNRVVSFAALLVTLAIVSGAVVSTCALLRERAARRQADERLRAALTFVDDISKQVVPEFRALAGAARAQEKLGQAGVKFLERLHGSAGADPALRVTLARLFIKTSDAQNPDNPNSVGDFEAGLQQARQAVDLLATNSLPVTESERLEMLCDAKFNLDMCLYGLGRIDEAIGHLDELDLLYAKLEQVPERARYARRDRQAIRNNAGYYSTLAGRPVEAIERFLLPILKSDWAENINAHAGQATGNELETLMNANAYLATGHFFLKQFPTMLRYAEESVRVADVLAQRFPGHSAYSRQRVRSLALMGYALTRTGQIDRGMDALKRSREEVENLIGQDAVNNQFRYQRAITAAIQAMAFAAWSEEAFMDVAERRQRWDAAEKYLKQAEEFTRAAKTKEPEHYVKAAQADVAAAKAKLQ